MLSEWISSGAARGRGSAGDRKRERWMVLSPGWSHQPQTLPHTFLNVQTIAWMRPAISTTLGWTDGQTDAYCALSSAVAFLKIRKREIQCSVLLYVKMMNVSACCEDKRMPASHRSGGQRAMCSITHAHSTHSHAPGWKPLTSSIVALIMDRITTLALFDVIKRHEISFQRDQIEATCC